jgi:superfamily II DNA or RNA helicase
MTDLRPYQRDVIAGERIIAAGTRRIIAVAPTGAGKTIIAASNTRDAMSAA